MRNMLIATAAGALLAAALPASAAPLAVQVDSQANSRDAQAAQQQRSRTATAGERRICVNEQLSGSRMRRPICRTAREWAELQGSEER